MVRVEEYLRSERYLILASFNKKEMIDKKIKKFYYNNGSFHNRKRPQRRLSLLFSLMKTSKGLRKNSDTPL